MIASEQMATLGVNALETVDSFDILWRQIDQRLDRRVLRRPHSYLSATIPAEIVRAAHRYACPKEMKPAFELVKAHNRLALAKCMWTNTLIPDLVEMIGCIDLAVTKTWTTYGLLWDTFVEVVLRNMLAGTPPRRPVMHHSLPTANLIQRVPAFVLRYAIMLVTKSWQEGVLATLPACADVREVVACGKPFACTTCHVNFSVNARGHFKEYTL